MVKLIYFDFGAVLVNYQQAFQTVCADFGVDFEDFWKLYHQFENDLADGKIKTEVFWQACIEKFNLKNAQNYDLCGSWVSDYKIIHQIQDLIRSLEGKIDIGIISNIGSGVWEAALKHGMVPDIKYKKVYLSYDMQLVKPDPKLYQIIQNESSVEPHEILFIDDMPENLVVPQELGWNTVLFDQYQAEDGVKKIIEAVNLNNVLVI